MPAHPPRDFWEALQTYWFHHLGVITELNGWDAFNPGHFDQHLAPFFSAGLADGSLDRERAKELLECLWVKFNNHPAPPKVGVTAAESGTYTDFANINLGGLDRDGSDAVNDVSYLMLEVIDEMHLLQPSNNIQLSRETSDAFLEAALGVIRKGYGFPSIFNADAVVEELVRQGKTPRGRSRRRHLGLRRGGGLRQRGLHPHRLFQPSQTAGAGAPRRGRPAHRSTGWDRRPATRRSFQSFNDLFAAWQHAGQPLRGHQTPRQPDHRAVVCDPAQAPFLSLIIDDCIARGRDYNDGGARYNTSYIQGVGIGSLTDSLSALKHQVFESDLSMAEVMEALDTDFAGREPLRQRLANKTPRYGNDDDRADDLMVRCFETFFDAVDGRPNTRGGSYHIDMLPTTCHVYFGSVIGALPDGRPARAPLSEGISPVQGADRQGPTAVFKSAAKMDHLRTGGTLLNMKFTPQLLAGRDRNQHDGVAGARLLRDEHPPRPVQRGQAETLREAQRDPANHRDLIVRVAGYSDYFCDISRELQDEIIERTEHDVV